MLSTANLPDQALQASMVTMDRSHETTTGHYYTKLPVGMQITW